MPLVWYVDDLKISHVSKKVIEEVISDLLSVFRDLVTQHGPKVTYLGIDIDFLTKGKIEKSKKHVFRREVVIFFFTTRTTEKLGFGTR